MQRWFDIDYSGLEDSAGNPVVAYDRFAIQNAIIKYLASAPGEYLYLPTMGGVLETMLFTSMTPSIATEIENTIYRAIKDNFSDAIENISVIADPQFETETWEVTISFTDKKNDNQISTIVINIEETNQTQNKFTQYIEITDTGDNLIEAITYIQQNVDGMSDTIATYNFDLGYFVWGNYRLVNFTPASSNFAEVIALLNG